MHEQQIILYKLSINEAHRFIERAQAAIDDLKRESTYTSKANATAKRASMDLTNSLVEIRRPV